MAIRITIIATAMLVLMTGSFYTYYRLSSSKLAALEEANSKLTLSIEMQKQAIDAIQTQYKLQTNSLMTLSSSNASLSTEKEILSNKLMKHDLEELSRRKPALVETRINNGTKDLFSSFRSITSK